MDNLFPFKNTAGQLNNIQPPAPLVEKYNLKKNDITIQFVLARPFNNTYKVRYLISIHPVSFTSQMQQIRASQINMVSLHDAIIENIDPYDRKYMVLKYFDTLKCEFEMNFDKWLEDAVSGISPRTYLSRFDQEYRLKVQPPKMIMFDCMRTQFFDFLAVKFKEYIVKKNKDKIWMGRLLPKDFQKSVNVKLTNLFDYEYDYQMNRVIVRLKTVYVIGVAYAVGMAVDEIKKSKNDKMKFSERVEKNASNFSKDKWKEFTKKRFI